MFESLDIQLIAQVFGWIASILAIASYAFKKVEHVRIVNCTAACFFVAYGIIIEAPAVIISNVTLALVHICYLGTRNKFGELISSHAKMTGAVFACYAIAMVPLSLAMTSSASPGVELLGVLSSIGVVGGFLIPSEKAMRTVCSVALVFNIAYAVLISSLQIVITNAVALCVNIAGLVRCIRAQQQQQKQQQQE